MELVENFNFYTECKTQLIESYGNIDIAKERIKNGKFSNIDEYVIEENLILIKESIGSKITNFFSKAFGGSISKIDTLLSKMKEEEIKFIHEEHEAESKFYKLTTALAHLKRDKASEDDKGLIKDKLNKLERFLKNIVSSHNSIMDDLEKQADIIIKKNKRRSEYYNLKRAEDSVETKKLRAAFKKKLIKDLAIGDEFDYIHKITISPEKAEAEAKKAEDVYDSEKKKLSKKGTPIGIKIDDCYVDVNSMIKKLGKDAQEKADLIKDEKLWGASFRSNKKSFLDYKIAIDKNIREHIIKIGSESDEEEKNRVIDILHRVEDILEKVEFFSGNKDNADELNSILDHLNKIKAELDSLT